jgi:protein TonB
MTPATLAADLLTVSAQIACVILVAEVLSLIVRVDEAAVRYQYWRALLLFCLVLPWLQRRQVTAASAAAFATIVAPSTTFVFAPPIGAVRQAPGLSWVEVSLWILVAGVVFRLARMAYGIVRLGQLRRAGRVAPVSAEHEELQGALGVRAEIRYVRDTQPVTCGVWRPVVLLPEHLTSQPPDIQRAVLAHELLHVKRRDWLWVMGEEVLRAALWFHPAVWWLVARVRLAREEAVDELTVRATNQRRAYLEALLAFADAITVAPSAAFGRRRHLFRRMTLISKEAIMSSRRIAFSLAVLVIGVVAGGWYAVDAFPLMQAPGAIQPVPQAPGAGEPGPLERSAKAITPENPIPRRTYSVLPLNPGGVDLGPVTVTLQVTINALGRVGEVRMAGGILGGIGRGNSSAPPVGFVKAASDAVRQWVYEPPADGPISFNVTFVFVPGSETRLVVHGTPVVGDGAVAAGFTGAPPQPPPPPPAPWVREGMTIGNPVRIGGAIMPPVKTKDVRPVYPPIAQSARTQGVVILEVVIGPDGRVDRVAVLRAIPLLDQAAMDAVKEWEFTPTLLNGAPVPVIMTVTVNFSLQ